MEERYLLTSGASAGLAAAFNAPLAGVIFALEELHRNFSVVVLLPAMAAAMTATVISHLLFGDDTIFDFINLQAFPLEYYGYAVLVSIIAGLAGVFFNSGLLNIHRFYDLAIFKTSFTKIAFAILCAGFLGFYFPYILGGGHFLVSQVSNDLQPLDFLLLVLAGKFLFTMISYGCGVPGGFFLPMLVMGALTGSICSHFLIDWNLITAAFNPNIIIIAMAAFFASSVRAPITGTVLIMEMTASYQQLLILSIASMVAFVTAELCNSKPIYEALLNKLLKARKQEARNQLIGQRHVIEISVNSGSVIDGRLIKEIHWPAQTLLVDVKRGESDLIPIGDTRIHAGDLLYILTTESDIENLRTMIKGQEQ